MDQKFIHVYTVECFTSVIHNSMGNPKDDRPEEPLEEETEDMLDFSALPSYERILPSPQ